MRRNAGVNQIAHYSPENNRENHQNYKEKCTIMRYYMSQADSPV